MYNFYDRFSQKITHRLVELKCPTDIVRFSLVAQNSILPLDLPQQEALNTFNGEDLIGFSNFSSVKSIAKRSKCIINTEEKCRKFLSPSRDFIYRLHLDIPKKRECSLKDGPEIGNMSTNINHRHIGKITVHSNFHFTVLASLVKEAVKRSDEKLKLIKWLMTFQAVTEDVHLSIQHVKYFVNWMNPEVTESAFVKNFVKRFDFNDWMMVNTSSKSLEFLLYHMCRNGGTLRVKNVSAFKLIEICFLRQRFKDITTVLKYQDAPRVLPGDALWFLYCLEFQRGGLSTDVIFEAKKRMCPRRLCFLIQLLFLYSRSPTPSAAEGLRLLWKSLPDAFLSFEEIEKALQAAPSSEIIRDMYDFYSKAVGVYHARVKPRSFKHLCRSAVRRMLSDCGYWIPDGIKLTGVPAQLESYLNLED